MRRRLTRTGHSVLRNTRRLVVLVVGSTVVLLGIAGFVLPAVPGVVLVPLGLGILGAEFAWARRLLQRARKSLPLGRYGGRQAEPEVAEEQAAEERGGERPEGQPRLPNAL